MPGVPPVLDPMNHRVQVEKVKLFRSLRFLVVLVALLLLSPIAIFCLGIGLGIVAESRQQAAERAIAAAAAAKEEREGQPGNATPVSPPVRSSAKPWAEQRQDAGHDLLRSRVGTARRQQEVVIPVVPVQAPLSAQERAAQEERVRRFRAETEARRAAAAAAEIGVALGTNPPATNP